ncbi:hypothetical protein [Methylocaldum szegediense]|uniref:hypothetical protein n=1 Tax=Methylocaldum szegediense TaxID=73780 RepID=UPI00040AA7A7|nr:hypothetical protein [Methylocaldum szegediense]
MLHPTIPCTITPLDEYDIYGRRKLSEARYEWLCAIVRLRANRERTSIRTDASGSSANAHEVAHDARLLMKEHFALKIGAQIVVAGHTLKVESITRRFTVHGKVDHVEVDCSISKAMA